MSLLVKLLHYIAFSTVATTMKNFMKGFQGFLKATDIFPYNPSIFTNENFALIRINSNFLVLL